MKNLKQQLNQKLSWVISDNQFSLKAADETLLDMKEDKSGRASFVLEEEKYIIHNEGFWNPSTIITKEGKQLLVLKRRFLGSKGKIEFDNGKVYSCKFKDAPLAKLTFFSKDKKEVLHYKLKPKHKPKTILSNMDDSVNKHELLMLIVLGYYSFKGIVRENEADDLLNTVAADVKKLIGKAE